MNPASNAYSIRSWPSSSRTNRLKSAFILLRRPQGEFPMFAPNLALSSKRISMSVAFGVTPWVMPAKLWCLTFVTVFGDLASPCLEPHDCPEGDGQDVRMPSEWL